VTNLTNSICQENKRLNVPLETPKYEARIDFGSFCINLGLRLTTVRLIRLIPLAECSLRYAMIFMYREVTSPMSVIMEQALQIAKMYLLVV
jgi:hypothetical protein